MDTKTKIATFGGGCFWGVEESFRVLPGVVKTTVGYTGGQTDNPTYKDVCLDKTGHVEAVQVEYNPDKISYDDLLKHFWVAHDPTQVNRQGPDVGTQYRSVIFYHNEEQKRLAAASRATEQEKRGQLLATKLEPAQTFYKAEEYHQQYLKKKGLKVCH